METDSTALGGLRRLHQLADGANHIHELLVMIADSPFEFVEPAGQIRVDGQKLSQSHKSAHYLDIHLHCAFAAHHAGKHGDTLFGKSKRRITRITVFL